MIMSKRECSSAGERASEVCASKQVHLWVYVCWTRGDSLSGGLSLPMAVDTFFRVERGLGEGEEFQRLLAILSFAEMAAVMILLYCRR